MYLASSSPIVDTLHGVNIEDPFRGMEAQNSQTVRCWTNQQTSAYRSYMRNVPSRSLIRKQVSELLSLETLGFPCEANDKLFYVRRARCQEQGCIVVREGGCERTLVDPNVSGTHFRSVQVLQVSRDGNTLAFAEQFGGEDTCSVIFLDVNSASPRNTLPRRGKHCGLAFSDDGNAVYHAQHSVGVGSDVSRGVFWFDLISGEERLIFSVGMDPSVRLRLIGGTDEAWMAYVVREQGVPSRVFLHNPIEDLEPRLLSSGHFEQLDVLSVGSRCWAICKVSDTQQQLVYFDARNPEPKPWNAVITALPADMENCAVLNQLAYVTRRTGQSLFTEVYNETGSMIDMIDYPRGVSIEFSTQPSCAQRKLYYRQSSLTQPPALLAYELDDRQHHPISSKTVVRPRRTMIETLRTVYTASDGVDIPIRISWDKEAVAGGPAPAVFTGYGGFGVRVAEGYSPFATILMQHGFRFVVADIRGGAGPHRDWHESGRRRNKPRTIDDFIDGAKWLIGNGFTTCRTLAAFGGSNSGLVVAAAMTREPDLFGAVLCVAPILDMLRYHKFASGYRFVSEYGSADDPEDFAALLSYSPYHAVRTGVRYPPVLFVSGEADIKCDPVHVRKMGARLQAAVLDQSTVLVDIHPRRGHNSNMPLHVRTDSLAERLAFICHELAVTIVDPAPAPKTSAE